MPWLLEMPPTTWKTTRGHYFPLGVYSERNKQAGVKMAVPEKGGHFTPFIVLSNIQQTLRSGLKNKGQPTFLRPMDWGVYSSDETLSGVFDSFSMNLPCEQRLHFRCLSWRAKSNLCRLPFQRNWTSFALRDIKFSHCHPTAWHFNWDVEYSKEIIKAMYSSQLGNQMAQ